MSKELILKELQLFSLGPDGIGGRITPSSDERTFERLDKIDTQPLTKVQLNQILAFGHEALACPPKSPRIAVEFITARRWTDEGQPVQSRMASEIKRRRRSLSSRRTPSAIMPIARKSRCRPIPRRAVVIEKSKKDAEQ